jgi:long-subunit acyl-CoA synthetase (AMP-forming)/heme oxygenase
MSNVLKQIDHWARNRPQANALVDDHGTLSYAELALRVRQLSKQLQEQNLLRIGLVGDNSAAWVVADLACRKAGVVCTPLPPFFTPTQCQHIASSAGLQALIGAIKTTDTPLTAGLGLTRLETGARTPALPTGTDKITFTSGSTATPKGVCLSNQQLDATVQALVERLHGIGVQQHLSVLPLSTLLENVAGIWTALYQGACVSLPSLQSLGFNGASKLDIGALARSLNRHQPQSMILVPELAQAVVSACESGQLVLDDIRFIAVGGARVSAHLQQRADAIGLPLFEGYGLSECGSVVCLNTPEEKRRGSVGRPLPHLSLRRTDSGELMIRGSAMLGYLGEPALETDEVASGDLADIDADGFVALKGRQKNLLITSYGRNIHPEWPESELTEAFARQVMVFGDGQSSLSALLAGVDDSIPGEPLLKTLAAVNQRLPSYCRIGQLYCLPAPLSAKHGQVTANGRIRRRVLMNELTTLLRQCCRLEAAATATPNNVTTNEKRSNMSFFNALNHATQNEQARLRQTPALQGVANGRVGLEGYGYFLSQAYQHVKHTVPLMMACGARLPERLEFVREALVEYIEEEYGHQEWILDDLNAIGWDGEKVRASQADTPIALMVSYLYDQIERHNPMALFGMVFVLEGSSIELATPLARQLQAQLKLPDHAFHYLYSHGELDKDHFEFFRKLMDRIEEPEDQKAIIDAAKMCFRLYADMLEDIPLQQQREVA